MGPGGEGTQASAPWHALLMNWVMRRHISGGLEYMGKCALWGISASSTPLRSSCCR